MPVTNYYTVNGQIIGESTGGVRTSYMMDPLGSVIGTVDENANMVNTYRYKPYGALLAKTGSGADPANSWIGAWGYRQTGKRYSDAYVRARHYGSLQAAWTTRDPLWPGLAPFLYAGLNPIDLVDPSGLFDFSFNSFIGSGMPTRCKDIYQVGRTCGWTEAPPNPSSVHYVKTDQRLFQIGGHKTSRIFLTIPITECAIGKLKSASPSRFGSDFTYALLADNIGSSTWWVQEIDRPRPGYIISVQDFGYARGVGHSVIHFKYFGSDPLIFLAPAIIVDASISLTADINTGRGRIDVVGFHTAFPYHESYIESKQRSDWLYQFTPNILRPSWLSFLQLYAQIPFVASSTFTFTPCNECS